MFFLSQKQIPLTVAGESILEIGTSKPIGRVSVPIPITEATSELAGKVAGTEDGKSILQKIADAGFELVMGDRLKYGELFESSLDQNSRKPTNIWVLQTSLSSGSSLPVYVAFEEPVSGVTIHMESVESLGATHLTMSNSGIEMMNQFASGGFNLAQLMD